METIVVKALEKDKSRRYDSASALAADIRHYLSDEPITARPPSAAYQFRKFAQRNKVLVGGVAVVFVTLVLGIIGTSIGMTRAEIRRREADEQRSRADQARDAERKERELAQQLERRAEWQSYLANAAVADAALCENCPMLGRCHRGRSGAVP